MTTALNQQQREKLFATATKAEAQQDWSTAAAALEQLYSDQQTIPLNHRFVTALFHDQQYQLASEIAQEADSSYAETPALESLRVKVLLANHEFIAARERQLKVVNRAQASQLLSMIERAEDQYQVAMSATLTTTAKHFSHINDAGIRDQQRRLKAAEKLPLAMYLPAARYVLTDPLLHPLIGASILEQLMRLKVEDTIDFQWFGQQTQVIPAQLRPVNATQAAQKIEMLLTEQLDQADPLLASTLRQNLLLHMMYLFPKVDEVITDPDQWIAVAKARLTSGESRVSESTEQSGIWDWQERLDQLTTELLGDI